MKKIVALAIVIALLVAGYGAAWLWAAGQAHRLCEVARDRRTA